MRSYTHIVDGVAITHLPRTSNRCSMEIEHSSDLPIGWYRSQSTWDAGWTITIGRAVDPSREATRLQRLADQSRYKTARTGSPGITGYQRCADAATAAIKTSVQTNEYFAMLLTKRS